MSRIWTSYASWQQIVNDLSCVSSFSIPGSNTGLWVGSVENKMPVFFWFLQESPVAVLFWVPGYPLGDATDSPCGVVGPRCNLTSPRSIHFLSNYPILCSSINASPQSTRYPHLSKCLISRFSFITIFCLLPYRVQVITSICGLFQSKYMLIVVGI